MVDGSTCKVSADGNTHDERAGVSTVGAPAHHAHLVAHLVHRGPDVVEELNLHHRLHTAHRHADSPSYDVCLSQWRVEDAIGAELPLKTGGQLEDAALPFQLSALQMLVTTGVRNIFTEDHDPRITPHLIAQRGVDEIGHRSLGHIKVFCRFRRKDR